MFHIKIQMQAGYNGRLASNNTARIYCTFCAHFYTIIISQVRTETPNVRLGGMDRGQRQGTKKHSAVGLHQKF